MSKLMTTLVLVIAAGCAQDPRPQTFRELCAADAPIACATDARHEICAGRVAQDAATCESMYVDECCAVVSNGHDGGPVDPAACAAKLPSSFETPTYEQFQQCEAAVDAMTCAALDARQSPAACDGVVK